MITKIKECLKQLGNREIFFGVLGKVTFSLKHDVVYSPTSIEEGLIQERRQRSSLLVGHVLEYCTSHLAASMIEEKFLGERPFWEGVWWLGVSVNHPFRLGAVILLILFFKSSWCKIAATSSEYL